MRDRRRSPASAPTKPRPSAPRSRAIGAEKAANKDGTIPAYTGGLTTPPAGFKAGDGIRPNPFAGEKPRLAIDAKNMAQHADKLTEGTKALLQKYPTLPRRRLPDAPQRRLPEVGRPTTPRRTR